MTKVFNSFIALSFLAVSIVAPTSALASSVACTGPTASAPSNFKAVSGPGKGETTLSWNLTTNADRFDLIFGLKSGQWASDYMYGGRRVANESESMYIVKSQTPGTKYYYRLMVRCGTGSGPATLTQEAWAIAHK